MVKVLIIGATGYIGGATAAALRKNNHRVYGLARTADKAKALAQNEIIPIEGSVDESDSYAKEIEKHAIDVIIDIAGPPSTTQKLLADLAPVAEARNKKFSHGPSNKIGFIYCGGMWVHGSSVDPVSDLELVGTDRATTNPPELVAWRPALEDTILSKTDLFDSIVVRPALVYGGISPIWGLPWGPIAAGLSSNASSVTIPVDAEAIASLIHVDDVATGFVAAVENLPILSKTYPVFDLSTSFEPVALINQLAARALGYKGKLEYHVPDGPDGLFPRAFGTTLNSSGSRLTALTGWRPTKLSMLSEVDIYAQAWLAANN
ncbi:NAD dependent epimerase/dehydratase family protein [Sugiyamaella lignohabitans]|uniref:NAD dependent epimerase/dehydratase family protein n=1 Tax=Sugiyamaella lignohabitans TaxID=796027 RepID=A0A167FPS3_9ASCO|nr:NAD dependent epimerase/dehydratase family protein [Sugiyamaella lignohabitans]ANB15546.1 NAD dependent epimerase/dehydratase family protein [Sugiyamaella lignohabitans]